MLLGINYMEKKVNRKQNTKKNKLLSPFFIYIYYIYKFYGTTEETQKYAFQFVCGCNLENMKMSILVVSKEPKLFFFYQLLIK